MRGILVSFLIISVFSAVLGEDTRCASSFRGGLCLDDRYNKCGVAYISGYCPGDDHIRCCTRPKPGDDRCFDRNSGRCQDSRFWGCSAGKQYYFNLCAGPACRVCCAY